MATTPRRGKPYIWVTWMTGILAGKQQCVYPAWFKAHYKYDKLPDASFDTAAWGAEHNAMVEAHAQGLEQAGRLVKRENENSFHLHGQTAIVAGKPDLTSRAQGQAGLRVSDGKTGEQSPKDWWQVLIYIICIPLAWKQPHLRIHGEVFYKKGNPVYVEPEEVTDVRKAEVFALVRKLAAADPPVKVPSVSDCQRCDLPDCAERMKAPDPEILTSEF